MIENINQEIDNIDLSGLKEVASRLAINRTAGDVITLAGPLGVGKTAFSKFYIQSVMGNFIEVPSPTFNIVQLYHPEYGPEIWHMDFFRLEKSQTYNHYNDLDLNQAFQNCVSLIEWPDRLEKIIPLKRLDLKLDFINKDDERRNLKISFHH